MNLDDKYFHSIHAYCNSYDDVEKNLDEKILKLERIFESGAILSREKIKQKYGQTFSHPYKSVNGNYCISVSKYKNSEEDIDKEYKKTVSLQHYEDAFQEFILQEPSIVIDSKIKEDLIMHNCGIYLERLVLNEIPLKYMKAIAVFGYGSIKPFFHKVDNSDFDNCYYEPFYKNSIYIKQLDLILELLSKYGYDVPVVDVLTGNEYKENLEYRDYINKQESKLRR